MKERNQKCATEIRQDFECLSEGIFPDPLNCKKYYNCFDNGQNGFEADAYECENLYVFDPNLDGPSFCRLTFNNFCVQAECGETSKNVLMNYNLFTKGQFVASCRKGKRPLVTRCDDGFTADLNTIPVECKLTTCVGPAKFEFREDSTKYFQCIFTGFGWDAVLKTCRRNYKFDRNLKECVFSDASTTKRRELENL